MALVGPTASGKTKISVALARLRPDAELVSMDSMSVYAGMDIGTAKPSREERAGVPWHLLDLVDPGEEFTVKRFQCEAKRAISDIEGRSRRPLLVGGTGLYLRAVVDDLDVPGRWPTVAADLERRACSAGGLDRLYAELKRLDPVAAARVESSNKRRVVRALEVTLGSGRPFSSFGPGLDTYLPSRFVLVGIPFDAAVVDESIERRMQEMLDAGLVDEVSRIAGSGRGFSRTAGQALGYREVLRHLEDGLPLDEALRQAVDGTRRFARRQWSWFRRDPRITWLDPRTDMLQQVLALWDGSSSSAG